MPADARREITILPVRQWLPEWEAVRFDSSLHRRRPPKQFYVASMRASELRALCDIRRRTTAAGTPRSADLGVQRRHNEARSHEISEFVKHGYPWSDLSASDRKSGRYDDLRKPGWLPTAIVVNVLLPEDVREAGAVAPHDLVAVRDDPEGAKLILPSGSSPEWQPAATAPLEVIDGQHRLWAFDEGGDPDYELPVVLFHGLDISWQAYLFYVINIKPAKINTSLAYDLYPLLRTEDWLEHAGGPTIYRESRAQELTEALWSYPESPWYQRIDMLGEGGRKSVSQAAWIRSLLATFVKGWESNRSPIGGLFGAPIGSEHAVLPWTRSQQAAFLISSWTEFKEAVRAEDHEWAIPLREELDIPGEDPAFSGPATLPNTDQGVRAILNVVNDLFYVMSDSLRLREWAPGDFTEGTSEIGIAESLRTLSNQPAHDFLRRTSTALATYDWRTYSAPGLDRSAQSAKARFRGSTGYRELRRDVLRHIANAGDVEVANAAQEVIAVLGWTETSS